jgi:hypothetical protein
MNIRISAFIMLALSLHAISSNAQKNFVLSGTVNDKKNGESIINATVRQIENGSAGAVTNEYGYYSLTLPEGRHTLVFAYIGYADDTVRLTLDKNTKRNVTLSSAAKALKEVVVTSRSKNDNVTNAQMGVDKLSIGEIKDIPVLFGEKDVMKTIQLLPGIKPAGEGNSGFYVRGGTAGQNLILLDEAPVYNPSHLLGFFSTFNSDAIKDASIYKGGMPAQYGGRLASVLDLKMNDGNNQNYGVSGSIGLISSKINVEGPIKKDKSSFLLSARRTYADAFLKLSKDSTYNDNKLNFYDVNGKINYKVSDKDKLYLSAYTGQDNLAFGKGFGLDWGNQIGTLRWNHLISDKLFSNTSVVYSDYKYNIRLNMGNVNAKLHSEIRDWNVKEEIELFASPGTSYRFGLNSIYHTTTPGEITGTSTAKLQDRYSWENAVYMSNKWKVNERLNIDYGVRLSAFSVLGGGDFYNVNSNLEIIDTTHYDKNEIVKTYFVPEPRISASYSLNENSSVKASYARNTQYLHLMSNSTSSDPTDKWVATNNVIKPEIADQVSAGYFKNLKDNQYEFSIEGYYKNLQNQIDYRDGAEVVAEDAIETQLMFGKGRAYGAELMLKKKTGNFTGWVSYTLSRSEKQIDHINNSEWYPTRQDRTHDLSIVGIYNLSKKWTVSGTWVFYTGDAVTFPSGKYGLDDQTHLLYTERNGYRMPAYHRLDLGATCKLRERKHFSSELTFSLYNAYGRQNAYEITFRDNKTDPSTTEAVQTSLFRWIPSVSYNFKF